MSHMGELDAVVDAWAAEQLGRVRLGVDA